jgi:hypothetical protein
MYHSRLKAEHHLNKVPGLTWADKVNYLGYAMRNDETCPRRHIFEPGWYICEIDIPASRVFIGRVHKHGHICKLVKGELILLSEEGRTYHQAVDQIVTGKGYQAVLYTLTDVVGRTYHPNPSDCRDVDKLDEEHWETRESALEHGRLIAKEYGLDDRIPMLWLE